jgi:protein gp37
MGENTKIQWADHTASFWEGCTKISAGCAHCYAESFEKRVGNDVWGKLKPRKWTKGGPALIRKLNKKAKAAGRVDTVFVNDLADFFEEFDGPIVDHNGERVATCQNACGLRCVPQALLVSCKCTKCDDELRWLTINDLREEAFSLFDECQNLIFMLLTKRPENIRRMTPRRLPEGRKCCSCSSELEYLPNEEGWYCRARCQPANLELNRECGGYWYRSNVMLGTSVENQEQAKKRINVLVECRDLAPVLFLSCEPLLGPVDLDEYLTSPCCNGTISECGCDGERGGRAIDWVIVGGESGHNARPCRATWISDIVMQCESESVPVFVKQLGSNAEEGYGCHRKLNLRDKKGGDMSEWPEDLRVRILPESAPRI